MVTRIHLTLLMAAAIIVACSSELSPVNFTDGGQQNMAESGSSYTWNFDDLSESDLPNNFFNVLGDWKAMADDLAPSASSVLKQSGTFNDDDFPRVVVLDLMFRNVDLSVRCRPESGEVDQACGLMFHLQDSDNYFITRANALEENMRFYKVVDGDRQLIESADIDVSAGNWHTLSVTARANVIQISWNEKEVISITDDTFSEGNIGLWLKADSITSYDDLRAEVP